MANIKKNIPYFAEREELAVISYINSDSVEEKNRLYNEVLLDPFRKMIESILRRYPIHIGNYDMNEVESNALTHLIERMIMYRPYIIERSDEINDKWVKLDFKYRFFDINIANDNLIYLTETTDYKYRIFYSSAFSYCQTIVRNYYKDHSKITYKDKKINLCYDDYCSEIEEDSQYSYEIDNNDHHYFDLLISEIIRKIEYRIDNDSQLKDVEIAVGDAVVNVLNNWQTLFMEDSPEGRYDKRITNKFKKNKILFFLKELTGLTTKEIRIGLKPFKVMYFNEKNNIFDI